ncbi:hypothetical protein SAMN04489844_2340 [Nocardioides exalbidus]|uniref:Alpha/beta hydrolase family protein n=1 Tax=Nocardioides exalbidus TaxID=402596 RepID=A0A1H4SPR9_9ACTN|nr:alpha/beta hydrolase [Nocardioides exalbidus]SEC46127.1 hypothetical protein SAMN04489844_2340 [Nocardioides exalbidus]
MGRVTRAGAVLCATALLVTGCSGSTGGTDEPAPSGASTGATADPTDALRERCGSAMPDDADLEAITLTGAAGAGIEAARIGPADATTVAVLLPQINGMCGWGRWATFAQDAGLTSLLVNPCGYGESVCTPEQDADPLEEVSAAVRLAREDLGARRVVLLGTSMGGSLTVMAVAAGADVDAWADISGPSSWEGVELVSLAGDLPAAGLVVMAPSDGRAAFRDAGALARTAGVRFLPGSDGHGWDLLVDPVDHRVTAIGRRLLALAEG